MRLMRFLHSVTICFHGQWAYHTPAAGGTRYVNSLTYSLTHSLTYSLTHILTHSLTVSFQQNVGLYTLPLHVFITYSNIIIIVLQQQARPAVVICNLLDW